MKSLLERSRIFFNKLFGCEYPGDEAINLEFGFIACGLSFGELMKELNQ